MANNHSTTKQQIIERLKEVYDPELPVNVYDLGLIYDITWQAATKAVHILMTLTTPSCPAAALIPANIKEAVGALPQVKNVTVEITFDPPYNIERLSTEAKLLLGYGN